jgi:hypothetical protein
VCNRQLRRYVFDYQQSKKLLSKKPCHFWIRKEFKEPEVDKNKVRFPAFFNKDVEINPQVFVLLSGFINSS